MRFRAHETFAIRKGWLHKGMKNIVNNPTVFIDKDVNPMEKLGLGTNMVKALRYWLQVTGLTYENQKTRMQFLTRFGKLVWENDKYIEEDGTLYLIHYFLSSNKEMGTSWYYFFNEFAMHEFTKEDYLDSIATHLKFKQVEPALKSLENDYTCILNTYIPKKLTDPEDNMECPLSELGLIEQKDKKVYKKATLKEGIIPPQVMLAMIVDQHPEETEIKIADILKEKNSVGKLFNLDFIALYSYLDKMQIAGLIQVVRTAGLDVIKIKDKKRFEDYVVDYYESIKN